MRRISLRQKILKLAQEDSDFPEDSKDAEEVEEERDEEDRDDSRSERNSNSSSNILEEQLCHVLTILRAQYISYQTSHWQVCGSSFYSDHLLFERLYGSVTEDIDKLAEKMVCYSGEDSVELESQAAKISSMCAKWSNEKCHYKRGMKSEQMLQEAIEEAYSEITRAKKMTLGLDDFLMALANAHEENIYLLKRSLKSSR